MRKYLSLKLLGVLCLASLLQFIASPQLLAQDDFDVSDSETKADAEKPKESEVLEKLFARMCQDDEKLGKRTLKKIKEKGKDRLVPEYYIEGGKPDINPDPFRPIIRKDVPVPPQPTIRRVEPVKRETPPKVRPPDPIKITVKGIVGNEGGRLAIVDFENEKDLTLTKDQIVEGKFKVVDIFADRVVIYANKEQRRQTFKINGDDK